MSKPRVYLAGPMSGLTWNQAAEWRTYVTTYLKDRWKVANPLDGQMEFTENKNEIIKQSVSTEIDGRLPIHHTASAFVTKDEFYIDNSQAILFNFLDAKKVSSGSIYELGYGSHGNKMIVTVIKPGSVHDLPFVRRRSHVFVPELDEALEFLNSIKL